MYIGYRWEEKCLIISFGELIQIGIQWQIQDLDIELEVNMRIIKNGAVIMTLYDMHWNGT